MGYLLKRAWNIYGPAIGGGGIGLRVHKYLRESVLKIRRPDREGRVREIRGIGNSIVLGGNPALNCSLKKKLPRGKAGRPSAAEGSGKGSENRAEFLGTY